MADEFLEMINNWYERCLTTDINIFVATDRAKCKRLDDVHVHLTPEVFMQQGGRSVFSLPDDDVVLEAGDILVIPAGVPHEEIGRNSDTPFESHVLLHRMDSKLKVHFAKLTPGDIPKEFKIKQYDLEDMSPSVKLLEVITELSLQGYNSQNTIRHVMASYLTLIVDIINIEPVVNKMRYSSIVDKAIVFIEASFNDSSCNVKTISDKINCTPNYLSAKFKKEVGITFSAFLYEKRMAYSAKLLKNTNLTVTQIAWESGYDDASYFIRSFKNAFNVSPKQYSMK